MIALLISEIVSENGNRHRLYLEDGMWSKFTRFADGSGAGVLTDRESAREFYELCEREGTVHARLRPRP